MRSRTCIAVIVILVTSLLRCNVVCTYGIGDWVRGKNPRETLLRTTVSTATP